MTKEQFLTTIYTSEDKFTADTHTFINHNYPELRRLYFHIANESATSDKMRLKLHSFGVLPGCPDFLFIYPKYWFLELKTTKGLLSPKQKILHEFWALKGIIVETAYTPQQVIDAIERNIKIIGE